jgi:nitroreductase
MSTELSSLDTLVRRRRSVRGFTSEPVPEAILESALTTAQWSPSNCNVQPWRVTMASGAARDRLAEAILAKFWTGQFDPPDHPVEIFHDEYRTWQVDCAKRLYGEMGVERHDKQGRVDAMARNFAFFDAPHLAIVCMDTKFGVGTALTVGMWMQTFLLALTEQGVQTCAMAAMRSYADTIREVLEIPAHHAVLCGIAIGYEDPSVPANRTRQPRGPLEDNVTWRR